MKFSYNWLKDYVPKIKPPQKVAADLTMSIFEVENVEKINNDWMLDIKILPNRAHDCLAHLGIAREIAAASSVNFSEPVIKIKEDKSLKIKDFLSVEVKEPKLCPRYSARVVVDAKVGDSPQWMQERLKTCGLRPINNIVDITNYVMLECGQPLHAFDLDKISEQKIIVRKAKKDEKIVTLDEGRAERVLNENILVIADEKRAIGIAGIKGGKGPEIDSKTSRVAIEAANFDAVSIRKSSQALNLRTDASGRFENSPDSNLTIEALNRAAVLIQQLAGGRVAAGIIDVAAVKIKPWRLAVAHGYLESLMGFKVKAKEILGIFSRLGLGAKQIKKGQKLFYEVAVPTRRPDLLTPEDLIEEVGRLYGYENVPITMPAGVVIPAVKNKELAYEDKIKDIMVGLGYIETQNYSFISEQENDLFKFTNSIEVKNPISQEQKYLRPRLIVGLLKNIRENLKHFSGVRLFELGHIFYQTQGEYFERNKISAVICRKETTKPGELLFELKGAIELLLEKLGLSNHWFNDAIEQQFSWLELAHPAKKAEIISENRPVGWLAKVKPELLRAFDIEEQVAVFELDFRQIVELASEERIYVPSSKYPAVIRDLSVAVGERTRVEEVSGVIKAAGGQLLQDIDLFDIYEDFADDRKSLSFRLIYQSDERNLSDAEINKLMEKIIKALEEKGCEVRK